VFETRYPWFTECYRLNVDAGGPGRTRGGLGITRLLHVEADEIVVSALCDRSRVSPWGVHGGDEGDRLAYLVRTVGSDEFRTFSEVFGTPSDTKFSNVRLRRGDVVMLRSPSGGGYGPPWERPPEHVVRDVEEGYVTRERASGRYGVVVRDDGSIDSEGTFRARSALRAGDGLG
jgi:N-methylhydantoinase B/oxoprolinase/acetone carboxylase alpha subunit